MSKQLEPLWLDGALLLRDMASALSDLRLVRPKDFEAAVHSPRTAYHYGSVTDICYLAAIYAYRIAKAHALLDGNKRTAISAALTFLAMNGLSCSFKNYDADDSLIALTTDRQSEKDFGLFLKANSMRHDSVNSRW